jgi:hypothetical protein
MMNNEATIARIRQSLSGKGIIKGNEIATQGYLRLGIPLTGTVNSISFNVLQNQGTTYATEKRLNVTDMFTTTHWGLYLVKAAGTNGNTASPTVANIAATDIVSARNYTYPNPYVFATAGKGIPTFLTNNGATALIPETAESNALYAMYNGFINVTIDRETVIDSYDTMRFLRVPGSQQQMGQAGIAAAPLGAGVAASATVVGYSTGATFDEWTSANFGFSEVDPQFTLNGIGDNNITINLPAAVNMAGTSSVNFVFLTLRGIRWQNASKLNA